MFSFPFTHRSPKFAVRCFIWLPSSIFWTFVISMHLLFSTAKLLEKSSRQYVYDIAKGGLALVYQRSIEGISLALSEAWSTIGSCYTCRNFIYLVPQISSCRFWPEQKVLKQSYNTVLCVPLPIQLLASSIM